TTGNRAIDSWSFADVRKGIYYTQPGHNFTVAVKTLRPSLLSDTVRLARKTIRREAKVWSTLNHPNVAQFIGVCCQDDGLRPFPRPRSMCLHNEPYKSGRHVKLHGARVDESHINSTATHCNQISGRQD
ncbi:uncharacterized protein EDB93DRAFT_1156649, partial [Suillus bovinus]